jgi:hypothetical protein
MKTGSSLRQTGGHATKFANEGEDDLRECSETGRREKVPADAANTHGLIYRHTRQAPSSHWAKPT